MKQQSNKHIIAFFAFWGLLLSGCQYDATKDGDFPEEKELVLSNMNVGEDMGEVVSIKSTGAFLVVTGKNMEAQVLLIDK
jgi:hypothetical protein